MLKNPTQILLSAAMLLVGMNAQSQVKVGDNPTSIAASSALEIESTTKALVPPRMTTAQMNAIASPLTGAIVYNTTQSCLHQYNGTSWVSLCTAYVPQVLQAVGTDALTINSGSSATVPGATVTITVPAGQTRLALVTVTGYAVRSTTTDGQASQGTFSILQDGTKISSGYVASIDGGDLNNIPVPVTIQKTVTLSAGSYVFTVSYKSWSDAAIVNFTPSSYTGYDNDSESMKTRITATVLPVVTP